MASSAFHKAQAEGMIKKLNSGEIATHNGWVEYGLLAVAHALLANVPDEDEDA